MTKKRKKMLIFVSIFLGATLLYDVYYFGIKKRRKSAPQVSSEDNEPSSKDVEPSSSTAQPKTNEPMNPLSWNAGEALAAFRKKEEIRQSGTGGQGDWYGDPFLLSVEENRLLPLSEIRRLSRVVRTEPEVHIDPYPELIETMDFQATLVSGSRRFALISGLVLGQGDPVPGIDGLEVKSIRPKLVIFASSENTYTKKLSSIDVQKKQSLPWDTLGRDLPKSRPPTEPPQGAKK